MDINTKAESDLTSIKPYPVAKLSEKEERMVHQLEKELGVVLIAYEDKQHG